MARLIQASRAERTGRGPGRALRRLGLEELLQGRSLGGIEGGDALVGFPELDPVAPLPVAGGGGLQGEDGLFVPVGQDQEIGQVVGEGGLVGEEVDDAGEDGGSPLVGLGGLHGVGNPPGGLHRLLAVPAEGLDLEEHLEGIEVLGVDRQDLLQAAQGPGMLSGLEEVGGQDAVLLDEEVRVLLLLLEDRDEPLRVSRSSGSFPRMLR